MAEVQTKNWHFYTGRKANAAALKACSIITGRANPGLMTSIFKFLDVTPSNHKIKSFHDGEVSIEIMDEVQDKDVFVIQSVCRSDQRSVNDALVELLLMISACRRASCRTVTAVLPYYAYARQDRKIGGRVPISAADVAHLITSMGVTRVICVDLHCGQIQGFFPPTVPVDNIGAGPVGAAYFSEQNLHRPVVVSPDAGGLKRAKDFRNMLEKKGYGGKTGLAVFVKQRAAASTIESMDLVGTVEGSDCILVDDMVDTAGTLCKAAELLKKNGARRILAFCTHGLFSGPAYERIAKSSISQLVVCNSVPIVHGATPLPPNVKVLDLGPMLAETIRRAIEKEPITGLYATKAAKL